MHLLSENTVTLSGVLHTTLRRLRSNVVWGTHAPTLTYTRTLVWMVVGIDVRAFILANTLGATVNCHEKKD